MNFCTTLMPEIRGPRCCDTGIAGYGNPDAGVFLVGISPAREEARIGKPMVGVSGKLIDSILKACGWSRDKCYVTNIVCTESREPTLEEIMTCRPRLLQEVKDYKPKLLVLLGAPVAEVFFPHQKFGNARGVIDYYAPWDVHVLACNHPAALLHSDKNEHIARNIVRDFSKIADFFNYPPNPKVDFYVIEDILSAQVILDNLRREHPKFVALDVETHLDKDLDETVPIEEQVICFSISTGETTWWFPGNLLGQLQWHSEINWTFHNGMFDTVAMQEAIGVLLLIKHDTMLMSYALDERGGHHKLKHLARENFAAGWYENHDTLKKWKDKAADTPWIQTYNSKDSAYTARLAQRLHKRMQDDNVLHVYENLLLPAANIYRHMQQHGIYVDLERYKGLLREYVPLQQQADEELREMIGSLGGDIHMNLNSPLQMRNFLYGVLRLPGGPSTAAPIIEALADEHPFIGRLLDYRHLEKAINTYLVGAWDDIRRTRRIHPNPGLHSQVTGRIAYTPYAVNTLPRETNENPYLSKIRSIFTAPDQEHTLLLIDYKQAEIYNAWLYCQDPTMWADLQSGDFHRSNAAYIYGVEASQVTGAQRSDAKRTTFGQFFGIGDEKLAKQTNKTRAEAHALRESWRSRYPGYVKYTKDIIIEASTTGELVTIPGRKRRFPILLDTSFVNQAINYKIQSTSHDYLLASIIEMFPNIEEMKGHIIVDIHDAVLIEAPKSAAKEIARCAVETMQKPRFGVDLSVPAEVKMGYSLGEVKEVNW